MPPNNPLMDTFLDIITKAIQSGNISSILFVLSAFGNVYIIGKLYDANQINKEYTKILKKIEPMLAKIIDGGTFTKSEKDDIKSMRVYINFLMKE